MLNNIKTRVINILDYFVDDLDSLCKTILKVTLQEKNGKK